MKTILGIDEVGRGPWAGPLVVGACILKPRYVDDEIVEDERWQEELKDSKKLSEKRRKELDLKIREKALGFGLGWVSAQELDEIGLSEALRLAARRAVEEVCKKADATVFDEAIIDGTQNFLAGTKYDKNVTVLTKADNKIKEVSAASILAKVARDNYMKELDKKYPEYGFSSHVGYGTKKHREALEKYGVCLEHRKSFRPVAKLVGEKPVQVNEVDNSGLHERTHARREMKNTTKAGRKAEEKVAEYLKECGHKILARNFRTRFYEIDIVSATAEHIYFTEVKYRKTGKYGAPAEAIQGGKLEKMQFSANAFMQHLQEKMPSRALPSPVLAAGIVYGEDFALEKWFEIEI